MPKALHGCIHENICGKVLTRAEYKTDRNKLWLQPDGNIANYGLLTHQAVSISLTVNNRRTVTRRIL